MNFYDYSQTFQNTPNHDFSSHRRQLTHPEVKSTPNTCARIKKSQVPEPVGSSIRNNKRRLTMGEAAGLHNTACAFFLFFFWDPAAAAAPRGALSRWSPRSRTRRLNLEDSATRIAPHECSQPCVFAFRWFASLPPKTVIKPRLRILKIFWNI